MTVAGGLGGRVLQPPQGSTKALREGPPSLWGGSASALSVERVVDPTMVNVRRGGEQSTR